MKTIKDMFKYAEPVVRQASHGTLVYVDPNDFYTSPFGGWDKEDHFLSFETKTVRNRKLTSEAFLLYKSGMDPDAVIHAIYEIAIGLKYFIENHPYTELVVEKGTVKLLNTGKYNFGADSDIMCLVVTVWPAIPGVTTPKKDTTL